MVDLLLFSTAPMVTMIMQELDLSHAEFGFVFSVAMISLILFRIPWGLLSDRIGYLNILRIALPLTTVTALVRAFSPSQPVLLLSQFFLGVGLAAMLPCLPLIIREWYPRNLGLSTGLFISGFAVGSAIALGITPQLLEIVSWRQVLMIYSGLSVVLSGLWWWLAKSNSKNTPDFQLQNFGKILKDRYVWVLLFLLLASMGGHDTIATWIPKILEMKGFNTAFAALLPLGFFLAGPLIGLATDKFHNRRLLILLLGITGALSILGINYAPFSLLLLCLFLSGFTVIGVLTIALSIPAQHPRLSNSVGSVVGFISSVSNVGPLAMPVLFGFLIDATLTYYASVLSVAVLVGAIFIICSRIKE